MPYDTTRFVEVSIREVVITLAEAMLLVFLVVFLFLQNWRATLIPIIAVPVSLIGTFAGLLMLGYSINTLTLFGMVLAIGIVVDDAIVVLENVERIMHEEQLERARGGDQGDARGDRPDDRHRAGAVSVFVPIAFLGGLTGELYRQFAITISIAVVISGVVALTLTPSLCVMMLKREHKQPGRFFAAFNRWFARVTHRYSSGVIWMIRRGAIALLLFGGMVLIAAGLWRDHAGLAGARRGPGLLHRGGDPARRRQRCSAPTRWSNEVVEHPHVQPGQPGRGRVHRLRLPRRRLPQQRRHHLRHAEAWDERSVQHAAAGGRVLHEDRRTSRRAWCSPSRRRRSSASAPPAASSSTSRTAARAARRRCSEALQALLGRLNSDPMLGGAQTLWRANVPQLYVDVDREKAKALGVPIDDVFDTLSATLGSFYVNDFNKYGRTWQVLM